ncbi:hypothetical protein [Deinococcus sp.]|uniref:hypothetical protein n=1 Tax=Deinococcus sp. TaxID=47478 RepID=UPI003C7CCAC1
MGVRRVLNIPVSARVLHAWEEHFAPAVQPFYLCAEQAARLSGLPLWQRDELHPSHLPLSVRDTLNLHDVAPEAEWALLLDEQGFLALPPDLRLELLRSQQTFRRGGVWQEPQTGQPFVWWPSTWQALTPQARWEWLRGFLEEDRPPCRRRELPTAQRDLLRRRFPELPRLMGSFAQGSGPNCFGSVMAACGVPGVEGLWLHAPLLLRWLNRVASPSDTLDACGTVLVWRDAAGKAQHAALSLGDGWLFHKEAQAWFAPRQVVRLQDALTRWHQDGWTVSGYALS